MIFLRKLFLLYCLLALLASSSMAVEQLHVSMIDSRSHDANVFTQGYFANDTHLWESSGLYGKSFLRRYTLSSGEIENEIPLPKQLFAEGLSVYNNELFLLTWRAGILVVYDPTTLQVKRSVRYEGEGWGLTHNDSALIMSDGSDTLTFRDPTTFKESKRIRVHNAWRSYRYLNELEFVNGAIWANVWRSPFILKISPEDGSVLAIANLSDLVKTHTEKNKEAVLNGIAYDRKHDAFWITGKNWPTQYLLRFQTPQKTKQ